MHRLLALLALLPSPLLAEPTEVIHILNYHHVSRDDYEQDVWSQDEHPVKGRGIYVSPVKEKKIIPILRFPDRFQMEINKHQKELYERYSAFLDNIEAIQGQQVTVLRSLIKKHSLKGVYLEGLTEKNHERTMKIIETIKKDEKTKSKKDEKAKPNVHQVWHGGNPGASVRAVGFRANLGGAVARRVA